MSVDVYKKLCDVMAQRGGRYPGKDIPEFYELAMELFSPEEAELSVEMPRKPFTVEKISQDLGRDQSTIKRILETMADKGLISSFTSRGERYYVAVPFVPGIFEFQFMRGTITDRDRRLARLIHNYKKVVDELEGGPPRVKFPTERVITVEKTIRPGARVHIYDQISTYIDRSDAISVSTCFCRHEARLITEDDHCGKPDGVCMQFGLGAQFVIERGLGRKVTKEEAKDILRIAEEAGLVHASRNIQEDLDFICNCCPCHCMILKTALSQPKPGLVLFSGFKPSFDPERCTACETCIDRCPAKALVYGEDAPLVNMDRCFGCGVCATGCPSEAIVMVEREGAPPPPLNRKALREAIDSHK
jgi:Pyruvate/2-oxoacid:ferredoxin oxidoreductase delta subunit